MFSNKWTFWFSLPFTCYPLLSCWCFLLLFFGRSISNHNLTILSSCIFCMSRKGTSRNLSLQDENPETQVSWVSLWPISLLPERGLLPSRFNCSSFMYVLQMSYVALGFSFVKKKPSRYYLLIMSVMEKVYRRLQLCELDKRTWMQYEVMFTFFGEPQSRTASRGDPPPSGSHVLLVEGLTWPQQFAKLRPKQFKILQSQTVGMQECHLLLNSRLNGQWQSCGWWNLLFYASRL